MFRRLWTYGLAIFLGWSPLSTEQGPIVLNHVEVVVTGDTTRPIAEEGVERFCPVCLDILKRYREEDVGNFLEAHRATLVKVTAIVDSLNRALPPEHRIQRVVLQRGVENIYRTESREREIVLSTGYFFLFSSTVPLRSALYHELGHSFHDALGDEEKRHVEYLWERMTELELSQILKEGGYPENFFLLGHPEDSPCEMFASVFSILHLFKDDISKQAWSNTLTPAERSIVLEILACVELCTARVP